MTKIMIVTYNAMRGVPVGRHENGNVIVYSGDYGRAKYAGIPFIPSQQEEEAERKMSELKQDLVADVQNIDEAYIYVGAAAMNGAMALIRDLIKIGKKVHMVACDCDFRIKQQFAEEHSLKWIESECGGRETCARLVDDLA
jgi:hypothetical protein